MVSEIVAREAMVAWAYEQERQAELDASCAYALAMARKAGLPAAARRPPARAAV
jgi:hypothetical protein